MKDLLPYFERELAMLRRHGREFAAHYPKLAARLHLSGDSCADPHVERLIQSSALLAARIARRLDDDYPQFTTGLLETLLPHYLRPFPSCSIVRIEHRDPQRAAAPSVAKGTRLLSAPVGALPCTFSTGYAIEAVPARLEQARFVPLLAPPTGIVPAGGASAAISVTLDNFHSARAAPLTVFIDGELSFCAALRDTLFMRATGAYLEVEDGRWRRMARVPISAAGFTDEEALIPFGARSHPAYRLLTEYFAFPEKFNFFHIDMAAIAEALPSGSRRVTLHLTVAGLRHDGRAARMLRGLSADNLLLGCTPIVNLFRQRGEPITVNHHQADYPVLAHPVAPGNFEVYTIDSVLHRAQGSGSLTAVRPFYCLHHGEPQPGAGMYWTARRDDELAIGSAGHETRIGLSDANFDPLQPGLATLSLELSCTNRDLPTQLQYGHADGDLRPADDSGELRVRMLRRPSQPCRFDSGGTHWRLISHLALNHHGLSRDGLPAFRELLSLYDARQSAVSQRQIAGIVGLEQAPATAWLRHRRGASLAHGIELRLTLDEDAFIGSGVHAFVQVLDTFLAQYVQANSFVELIVLSQQSGEELMRCEPKSGDMRPV